MEATAVSWILYALTHSALALGLGGLFRAAPVILLSMLGGALADRLPRRALLLVSESGLLALSLSIGLLALSGHLAFWHLYLLNLLSGSLSAFEVPGRQALFPGLVSRSSLPSAVTMNALGTRSAALIGPALAGLLLAAYGFAAPFLLNSISFFGMLGALLAMRTIAPVAGRAAGSRLGMLEGLGFVWRSPVLRALVGMEMLSGLFGHNTALITIIARDVLHVGPQGLGLLLSCLGGGSLLGMAALSLFPPRRRGRVLLASATAYCVLLAAFGASRSLSLSALLLVALGAADGVWAVTRNVIAQLVVPDRMRGRAMSVVVVVTRGFTPLGQVRTGAVAAIAGGPVAAVLGAAVVGAGILLAGAVSTSLRDPEPVIEGTASAEMVAAADPLEAN